MSAASLGPIPHVCSGDGVSGKRVAVVYARASDRPDRYSTSLQDSLRTYAGVADASFSKSAQETAGDRRIRFVHGSGCGELVVTNAVMPATGDDSFDATVNSLRAMGHNRTDRMYMVFVDANPGFCGMGHSPNDDSPGSTNIHNTGNSFGITAVDCWGGDVAAHELVHNLGGVQHSAPHSTGQGHCTDEYDLMCYDDDGAGGVSIVCTNEARDSLLDCNHDDYFHTNPPTGSYLATHWNTANNQFLITAPPPPPPPGWTWETLGGGLSGSPDAASYSSGRLDVFIRGTDDQLWRKYYSNGWSAWQPLGGTLASDPTAVSWASGRIDVFARDLTGTLIHKWCNSTAQCNSTSWSPSSGWEALGGTITGAPDVSTLGLGRLDVFARSAANTLVRRTFDWAWQPWVDLGGVLTSDPTAVRSNPNEIHVLARDINNTLIHKWCKGLTQCNGTAWTPTGLLNWESLGGPSGGLASEPDVSSWGDGRLDVFVRGTDNKVWQKFHDNGWSGWASRSSSDPDSIVSSGPGVVSWGVGRVDVFARNSGTNSLTHGWYP